MQQHPVPQNIASFKLKLFGSLTARQFFTLIIPLSLAAVIYFSNLPSFIRIPLALTIGGFAFFIALVPIGGRPFDKWAVAFIRAVMSPTQRVWIKEKKIPEFLERVRQIILEREQEGLPDVIDALRGKAETGDPGAARLWLQYVGEIELRKLNNKN